MEIVIILTNSLYPDGKNLLAPHEEISWDRQIIPQGQYLFGQYATWGILDALARGLQIYHVSSGYLRLMHNTNCLFMRVRHMENALRSLRAKKYYIRGLPQPIAEEIEEHFDGYQYTPSCACGRGIYLTRSLFGYS